MDSKRENKLLAFLNGSAEEDQDPVKFFEWAGYPSWNEGHAGAVWKTTVRGLDAEKAIVLETRWANSKDRRREYWEKLRRKEEAAKKMVQFVFEAHFQKAYAARPADSPCFQQEEWSQKIENVNSNEQDIVFEFQHHRFKKFMDDKISPFITKDEPSPPYTPPFPNKRPREAFAGGSESSWEVLMPGDIIDALQEMLPHQRMGELLGLKREHIFSCVLEDVDMGALFTQYFEACCLESYKHGYPEDALRENMAKRMDTLDQLHSDWKEAKDLDLAAMHTYFVMCIQGLFASQPLDFQEADGIASFIRNLLAAFLQEVDLVRFSCADKGSEASRYNKAINQLQGKSKQPDMVGIFTYEGVKVETFFGEASSVAAKSTFKYGGDTIRLGVFGKNGHDMINNLVDLEVPLLLFNINGLVLQAFVLEKVQDIYAMLEIGTGRIPCSVNDLLFLSQDLPFWLQLREIAKKTSASIERAVDAGQIDYERRKSFYPTITTPSARGALSSAK
ncbi:hypothetical protein BGZ54_007207 [Gamsiella multidivaricata]|nr:hypothetical protein BGZ54_007207 [Gamsiella multidivaricata]